MTVNTRFVELVAEDSGRSNPEPLTRDPSWMLELANIETQGLNLQKC